MSASSILTHHTNTAEKSPTTHRSAGKRTPFFNHSHSFFQPQNFGVQPKLTVNAPNDIYEKEADPSADGDKVMRMPDPLVSRQPVEEEEEEIQLKTESPAVQRMCAECEQEEKSLHRKPIFGSDTPFFQRQETEINDQVVTSLKSTKDKGRALPDHTRSWMESRFGADFSGVKVHTDSSAVQLSRDLNAQAFTHGSDIYFNQGKFAPGTSEGKRLLAHELTHVVQQRGGKGQKIQCDFARNPRRSGNPVNALTPEQIQTAINYNSRRFRDPYIIGVIRDVLGVPRNPMAVDQDFVEAVLRYQALWRLPQNGRLQHSTRFRLYKELISEGLFRDAILFLIEAYTLRVDSRLHNITVGTGPNICNANGSPSDAVTEGGAHCPPTGGPIVIRFCLTSLNVGNHTEYNHLIRIIGHELVHVPQCAGGAGTGNIHVLEFEAFHWEACGGGGIVPGLTPAQRVGHANTALTHFNSIPLALQTPARIHMRNQLNALINAGGVGAC